MSEAENLDISLDCRDGKCEWAALMAKSETVVQYENWIQRDGTPIRIIDMGDGHLLNTIKMVQRRSREMAEEANAAQNSIDPDEVYFDYEPESFCASAYSALIFEAKKRGFVIPAL